ncbi:MAG: hypothetical protein ACOX5Z_09720 [Desulfobulbus sp.]|jgi:hypothetical protein
MKKVMVAGAALLLVGGIYADNAAAAKAEPGVQLTGDARARIIYKDKNYRSFFGNNAYKLANGQEANYKSSTDMDSRVRLNITGTAAGGAYAKARIRLAEGTSEDLDRDSGSRNSLKQENIWVDRAYIGIPFNENVTVEVGRYRSTYGPLKGGNFFYDDVSLAGVKGIITWKNVEINPFIEWMEDGITYRGTNSKGEKYTGYDFAEDNDAMRYGANIKAQLNENWLVGALLGYQTDERREFSAAEPKRAKQNEGFFGSLYTAGKHGNFGLVAEFAVTEKGLNAFNSWRDDDELGDIVSDHPIGSNDTGYGGYIYPTYTINQLTLGLNLGFTVDGFMPDTAAGFVMLGNADGMPISVVDIGDYGDWLWAGLVVQYQVSEALKLTGNLVYADIDTWSEYGDGPGFYKANSKYNYMLDSAWEISGILQYTISKGLDWYLIAGYMDPDVEAGPGYTGPVDDDATFAAYTKLELKF